MKSVQVANETPSTPRVDIRRYCVKAVAVPNTTAIQPTAVEASLKFT
jgi:hypothetical protein